MSWVQAIGITVGLIVLNDIVLYFCEQMGMSKDTVKLLQMILGAITILGSAYWVRTDSEKIEVNKYDGAVQGSPNGLAIVTVLLWPLVFPAYLQKRYLIKNRLISIKPEFHPNYRKPS